LSNNFGTEGPSADPAICEARLRHQRALLAATVLSRGTPMLLAGDDIGHSQQGNNNAYCQDNATTWLNWEQADHDLHAFVAGLLRVRRERAVLQSQGWWQPDDASQGVTARWTTPQGAPLNHHEWNDARYRTLALHLHATHGAGGPKSPRSASEADCLLMVNASPEMVAFQLPAGVWFRHLDTASGQCADLHLQATETLAPHSLCLLSTAPLFSA
jgi:glycogen operon protein